MKIGYVWQYESEGILPLSPGRVSATALHVEAVVRAFERRGHSVRMVALRKGRPHWTDNLREWIPIGQDKSSIKRSVFERSVRGIQSRLHLPYFRFFDSDRFARSIAPILNDCDVFYERFWLLAYGGMIAADRLRKPIVYEVNGDIVEEYSQLGIELPLFQWEINKIITQSMFRRAARVVTVSETLRERTISRWSLPPDQVVTVDNGAQVDLFALASEDGSAQKAARIRICERYGLDGGPLVMFVGSFKPWHGLDLLIEGFAQLAKTHPQVRLVLVGDGSMRSELEEQAKALGLGEQVIFTGGVSHEEVAALLSVAQVAVLNPRVSPASLSQSPLKLFEYMAAGKAILAPDIPNVKRIVIDGETALLVEPDDPDALANGLARLFDDPSLRQKLGQAARQKSLTEYSWDTAAARLEEIFDRVTGGKTLPYG